MSRTARRGRRSRQAALPPARAGEPVERSPAGAERSLLESIASIAALVVGDHVRINQHARPRYLQGFHAIVIDVDEQTATISLGRADGRAVHQLLSPTTVSAWERSSGCEGAA